MKAIFTNPTQVSSYVWTWAKDGSVDIIAKMKHEAPLVVVNVPAFVLKHLSDNQPVVNCIIASAISSGNYSHFSLTTTDIHVSSNVYGSQYPNRSYLMITQRHCNQYFKVLILDSELAELSKEQRAEYAVLKINLGECIHCS